MTIFDNAMKTFFRTSVPTGFTAGAIAGLITMAVFAPSSVQAHDSGPEFIETFDTRLEIGEPGGLSIREAFTVHQHGENIPRSWRDGGRHSDKDQS